MLTKPPDYMISDCGCPELWSSESKHLPFTKLNSKFWNSYTTWCNNKSTQLTKLLPLRESWTDYYTKNLQKQTEESQKFNRLTSSSSNVKQQKNHHNEVTKKRSFHYNSKRLNDANTGTLDAQRSRSRAKSRDTELDQF